MDRKNINQDVIRLNIALGSRGELVPAHVAPRILYDPEGKALKK
jgi:hypothetical protein